MLSAYRQVFVDETHSRSRDPIGYMLVTVRKESVDVLFSYYAHEPIEHILKDIPIDTEWNEYERKTMVRCVLDRLCTLYLSVYTCTKDTWNEDEIESTDDLQSNAQATIRKHGDNFVFDLLL